MNQGSPWHHPEGPSRLLTVPESVRTLIEKREVDTLSEFAAKANESAGRLRPEEPDPVRTAFQRDRDRILHCKSFRRLKHKTQVFIDPFGDHYRTRLTHSLEVAQIARTIGRALRLNEDLIEAIALGHDVGHTPFGHAGEAALDEAIQQFRAANPLVEGPSGFSHSDQSARIVDVLENLNLTHEVRAGIGGHSKGRNDLSAEDGRAISTIEAAVVRISDRVAYVNHDLDDALRARIIEVIPAQFLALGESHSQRIGSMVLDIIEHSMDQPSISMSDELFKILNALKEWLFDNVYLLYPVKYPDIPKAKVLVSELFRYYVEPGNLPEGFEGLQGAIDYVAGMTDRYAMDAYAKLRMPSAWRLP